MKTKKQIPAGYVLFIVWTVVVIIAEVMNITIGRRMVISFHGLLLEMVVLVPCIFILIGLIDVWIPEQWIQNHLGENSGLRGAVLVILLAMFQGGPLYGAFPTAHLLRKKGCSLFNVFMYLGAFSALKAPMVLFEAGFLGWKFAIVRAGIALPVFTVIAWIMARYCRGAGLRISDVEPFPTVKAMRASPPTV